MLGFVVRRATLLAAVVGLGCSEQLLPPEVLTDHPVLLAWRTVVVEEGVHSQWVLPLPADRSRSQPLPLDTIEVTPMFADNTGIRDTEDFDLQWFVCGNPYMPCVSFLSVIEGAVEPCGSGFPQDLCQLPSGPRVRYTTPEIGTWVFDGRITFAFVGSIPGGPLTTDECVVRAAGSGNAGPHYDEFGDCLLGYLTVGMGPQVIVDYVGEPHGEQAAPGYEEPPLPYSPVLGNPELGTLVFAQCTHPECETFRRLEQLPSQPVRIPTGSGLSLRGLDRGQLGRVRVYPTDAQGWDPRRRLIVAPAHPTTLLFVATQAGPAGGQTWTEFEVEVYRP